MKDPKYFVLSTLMLLSTLGLRAQNAIGDCDAIRVEVKAVPPSTNSNDGTIELLFSEPKENYRIFFLNAGPRKTEKIELTDNKIANLPVGFFDFLVLDKNRNFCLKQLTVVLK